MDIYASEKEQVEALKKWWKENGSSVVTGLLLGLSLLLGGKAWFSYQDTQAKNASNIYAQMMGALKNNESEAVRSQANELISNHSGSGYAPLAALVLAKLAVNEDELEAARGQLQWALDHAALPELQHTARTRLLQVLIAQQQYEQAAKLLASVSDPGAYRYLYAELEGDLAMAQGKTQDAAKAYKQALENMPKQAANATLLTAKYENIAGAVDLNQ